VPNKEKQDNIPPIPGLVLYRKDNNNLYVNNGTTWKTLSNQKQVGSSTVIMLAQEGGKLK
jgi:hypothetical protein